MLIPALSSAKKIRVGVRVGQKSRGLPQNSTQMGKIAYGQSETSIVYLETTIMQSGMMHLKEEKK